MRIWRYSEEKYPPVEVIEMFLAVRSCDYSFTGLFRIILERGYYRRVAGQLQK